MKENLTDYQQPTVFDKLLEPVQQIIKEYTRQLVPHHNEKFSFPEFFRLLIFYFASGIPSAKLLINTLLKKDLLPSELNLPKVPYTTFSDAFERFPPDLFKTVFIALLSSLSLHPVPELSTLGLLYCVDGSLFPTLNSMHWASYKKNCNAARLHLCFELNRMIPADIVTGSGNSAERDALRRMLRTGATYIADRGYAGFLMFHYIVQAQAHFIIRVKTNWLYTPVQSFSVQLPDSVASLFSRISDEAICYDNEPRSYVWRLIRFQVCGEPFHILTDRFDLTTFQVIMLYAYRWQVELFFRFMKRTMNGIHLIKHNENGVAVQFYAVLITSLLQLKLKQDTVFQKERSDSGHNSDTANVMPLESECHSNELSSESGDNPGIQSGVTVSHPYHFFEMIGKKVSRYWKIGIHWLTILRQILYRPFDDNSIEILGSG